MFKNLLATKETYTKLFDEEQLDRRVSAFEIYIEAGFDKEGMPLQNRDGSQRFFPINDEEVKVMEEDTTVKKIDENFFKELYTCNGDLVEKVEKDGRRMYFAVEAEKTAVLPAGTVVRLCRNNCYRTLNEKGFVIMDTTDEENARILSVRQFKQEDHKAEAENALQAFGSRPRPRTEQQA